MADNSFESLVAILRDHDVTFDRDALKSAFDDPESQTAIEAWMREYTSSETLLSKDEATLYSTLENSGKVDALVAAHDLSAFPALSDQDIQQAIKELKRSTSAIEKQTENLKLQQNAMSTLVKNNSRLHQEQAQAKKSQQRNWEMEKAKTIIAVEELSQNIKDQAAELEQRSKASEKAVKQTVEDILRADDKLLSSFQKLASDLDPVQSEDGNTIARIKELCARLIKYTVEGIRTKLDRIYLEALNAPVQNTDFTSQDVAELQEELESLYAEILPVAQMSAEQQYLQPALRTISAKNGQGQDRTVKAVKYMHDCLEYLVKRTEVFVERAQEQQCHKMALKYVMDEAKRELERSRTSTTENKPKAPKSPTMQRTKSSGPTSPVRKRPIRRRSSGQADDELEPEQQLLRNLGISLPHESVPEQQRIDALEKAQLDRANKLEAHWHSLQSSTETSISSHLLDAHITLHLLRNSLLAQSPYNNVSVLDPDVESSLSTLQDDVERLQERLEGLDLKKLQARNPHREQLVERWSR